MRSILTILLSLTVSTGICQSDAEALKANAGNLWAHGKYDSALHLYQQFHKMYPANKKAMIQYCIGDCFRNLGNHKNAEKYFLRAVAINVMQDDSVGFFQYRSAQKLGDLYYERKKYAKALEFFNATTAKFKVRKRLGCGNSRRHERNQLALSKAKCFIGLHLYDSAAKMLEPFMFQDLQNSSFSDSLYNDSLSKVYAAAVINVYGKGQARQKVEAAVNNLYYNIRYTDDPTKDYIIVDCFFELFAKGDDLRGFQIKKNNHELMEYVSKQNITKEITSSAAYRYIMYDECTGEVASPGMPAL